MFNSLFTFCQCLVIAGLVAVVVFSFLACSYCSENLLFMDSKNYYCLFMDSEKSAICSPFALCACLWCWWYVCLSNGVTWRYGAMGGRGGVLNEVVSNISIFWGIFRLNPLIILALKC